MSLPRVCRPKVGRSWLCWVNLIKVISIVLSKAISNSTALNIFAKLRFPVRSKLSQKAKKNFKPETRLSARSCPRRTISTSSFWSSRVGQVSVEQERGKRKKIIKDHKITRQFSTLQVIIICLSDRFQSIEVRVETENSFHLLCSTAWLLFQSVFFCLTSPSPSSPAQIAYTHFLGRHCTTFFAALSPHFSSSSSSQLTTIFFSSLSWFYGIFIFSHRSELMTSAQQREESETWTWKCCQVRGGKS